MKKVVTDWIELEKKEGGILTQDWIQGFLLIFIVNLTISDLNYDDETFTLTFKVDFDLEGFKYCSMIIPESYPKGMYNLIVGEDFKEVKGKSFEEVMDKIMEEFEEKRLNKMTLTPSDEQSPTSPLDDFESPSNDPQLWEDDDIESKNVIQQQIENDLKQVTKQKGWFAMV